MTTWTHVGNVQNWDITPNPTIVKHKNTQGGLKRVDLVAMTLVEMAFSCKLDEWTPDNIKMALLGTASASTAGQIITIGTAIVQRQMKFTGANLYGPQWEIILPSVFINAKDTLSFLGSDEFASIPLSGDILFNAGISGFGTAEAIGQATAVLTAPNELNYYLGTGSVYTAPLA
jgi:hypothetical protein